MAGGGAASGSLFCWQPGGGGSFPLRIDKSLQFHLQVHRQTLKRTLAYDFKVELILVDICHL